MYFVVVTATPGCFAAARGRQEVASSHLQALEVQRLLQAALPGAIVEIIFVGQRR